MQTKKFVIAGIGTNIGKTITSAVLCKALSADYWKPIQAGDLLNKDSDNILKLTDGKIKIHPETYQLQYAMSPHASAKKEGLTIEPDKIIPPDTNNTLLIEMAGGIMVPLNSDFLFIDLLAKWDFPVIIVSKNYLGSINHTLLTIFALRQKNIPIAGIIFNGNINEDSESVILKQSKTNLLGHIDEMNTINLEELNRQSLKFKNLMNEL